MGASNDPWVQMTIRLAEAPLLRPPEFLTRRTLGAGSLISQHRNTPTGDRFPVPNRKRIPLSVCHMTGDEIEFVKDAFATNWIAPLGPHVDAFEREFASVVGVPHAAALSSGTAAIHLALKLIGLKAREEVFVSTLTFAASVNPILYEGGIPVFIDSERQSWNMDPALLAQALHDRARKGRLPRAVIVVHLYGQTADMDAILAVCAKYDVPVIEDAAEALGATYGEKAAGSLGKIGIYSFNGNKIITTSGGGMLVSADEVLVARARKLATQAREATSHYEHVDVGYNYRLSNVLAGIGRGQLQVLSDRVAARRKNFESYSNALCDATGIEFMPEAPWGRATRWLTACTIDPAASGTNSDRVRLALEHQNIECRPVWKPMHQQPVFAQFDAIGGAVADDLFARGLCLPSGSSLTAEDLARVIDALRAALPSAAASVTRLAAQSFRRNGEKLPPFSLPA